MSDVMEPEKNSAPDEQPATAAPRTRKRKKKASADVSPVEVAVPEGALPEEPAPAEEPPVDAPSSPEEHKLKLTEPDLDPEPSDDDAADADTGEPVAQTVAPEGGGAEVTTEQVVEAILFGADTPLPPAKIVSIVGVGSARDVRQHIENLNERYKQAGVSFRIEKMAGGYQMLTLPEYNPWLKRLKQTRQESKLSQAAMETLAVVAYKQPVVRAEIEAIRGVAAGEMLNRLREVGLVKIVGRAEDVGRPLLYGTTKRFLDVFGLGSLEDLPSVEELKAPE